MTASVQLCQRMIKSPLDFPSEVTRSTTKLVLFSQALPMTTTWYCTPIRITNAISTQLLHLVRQMELVSHQYLNPFRTDSVALPEPQTASALILAMTSERN